MLNILVCMKQVLDPEAPVSGFRIDDLGKNIIPPPGTMPVLSPFDENVLEGALMIKDARGDVKITVISMGANLAKPIMQRALACGADELILLEDPGFEDMDSFSTATILAEAIKKIGEYDVIFCGRQAADTDAGLVGPGIADILGVPLIAMVQKVEVIEDKVRVEQITDDGLNVLEAALPILITGGNEIGQLRYPSTKNMVAAKKKKPIVWNAKDLDIDAESMTKLEVIDMYIPVRKVDCQMITAATSEEAAIQLAKQLKENGVI